MPLVRLDLDWGNLAADVYFRPDFGALHARPDAIVGMERPDYRHIAAVRPVPGTSFYDLETPHGYGGPIAPTEATFSAGLADWRQQQRDQGRICEFVRVHPFFRVEGVRSEFDHLRQDRLTVTVDLARPGDNRRKNYSKTTRNIVKRALDTVTIRTLAGDEWPLFRDLYHAGLDQNTAQRHYYFDDNYYRDLLAAPWCRVYAASDRGEAVAAASFLVSGAIAHYHLSGQTPAGRDCHATYALLDHAFDRSAAEGAVYMHLGGGRGSDPADPLFQFKRKFSDLTLPFYIGGFIFDRELFSRLGGGRDNRFQSYRAE